MRHQANRIVSAILIGVSLLILEPRSPFADDVKLPNGKLSGPKSAEPKSSDPAETPTHQLLDTLRTQNSDQLRFKEPWLRTLKEIVDLGPTAVPELIVELDETNDNMMMRCLGFTLRAIGDKRAVPALIRAVPKTLLPPCSDMGLQADDPELLKFAQQNDLDKDNEKNRYGVGRPVREIVGAIQKLTANEIGDDETFHTSLIGSSFQKQRKIRFFQRKAKFWAEHWEQNWAKFVDDKAYSKVGLPELDDDDEANPPSLDAHMKTDSGGSNWILESILNPKSVQAFYDFDTGRAAALPDKWRHTGDINQHLDEIVRWATKEGFDLMGTEYQTAEGRKIFALRSLAMHTWELGAERWKMTSNDITLRSLQDEGRATESTADEIGRLLFHYDLDAKSFDPLATASFLFVTRHGTPGLLFVGIEVQDDSLKPGGVINGDQELKPIHFRKGRRFAFSNLEESR